MKLRCTLAGALVLATLANARQPEPKPAPSVTDAAPKAKPESEPAKPATVHLIDAGAQPRTQLRYAPRQGDRSAVTMTMKMAMQIDMGNGAKPPKVHLPPMIMVMNIQVLEVKPDGDIRYSADLVDTSVGESLESQSLPVEARDRIETSLKSLVGFSATATVSSRGETRDATFHMPDKVDPTIQQSLDGMMDSIKHMSTPLPEDPVGAGAKWEVTQEMSGKLKIDQTISTTLDSIDGKKFKLSMGVTQTAPVQEVKIPTPGAKVELLSMESTGSGTFNGDLTSILPTSSGVSVASKQKMKITTGEQVSMMRQAIDLDIKLKSGPLVETKAEPAKSPGK